MFGNNTTHESIRIARAGGVPATANITKQINRLNNLSRISKGGGIALVGVGVTAACLKIASATETKEKNKIFVDTITSTLVGGGISIGIGLYLISNPVGWGTAIVLAVSSTGLSYGLGKLASSIYDTHGEIDFVSGTGTDRICK